MKPKILIVSANYYKDISTGLEAAAGVALTLASIKFKKIEVAGVFEIPVVIAKNIKKYDGFIALGCIIRGETYHFEIISNEVTRKIMDLSVSLNKPIGFGILTCENKKQAQERSSSYRNKGIESAKACLKILLDE